MMAVRKDIESFDEQSILTLEINVIFTFCQYQNQQTNKFSLNVGVRSLISISSKRLH